MAGGTHVFDMIKRLRDNENLKKKSYFNNDRKTGKGISEVPLKDNKEITQELKAEIKNAVRKSQREETRKVMLMLIIAVFLTVLLLFGVFYLLRIFF